MSRSCFSGSSRAAVSSVSWTVAEFLCGRQGSEPPPLGEQPGTSGRGSPCAWLSVVFIHG